ncbi:hypothetical protein [Streptomyces olivochromogenes]|nr:hypothetical protein [Streptomyces olivochromogenes]
MPHTLPHWPYATAVGQALVDCGVPPGIVRVDLAPARTSGCASGCGGM